MDKTALGDRQKLYEEMESDRRLMPLLPAMARIDGRCFSKFTMGMKRPYDEKLSELMKELTLYLTKETNALIGYTQSDEISLCWQSARFDSQIFFDGRIQKMVSTLAAMATEHFNDRLLDFFSLSTKRRRPTFDARVWNVPTQLEAANCFLWREQDATRNSIQSAARSVFSDKECFKKNGGQLQEMLFSCGINWNDYPAFFKRGTWIQRRVTFRGFTTEELEKLPEKHEARINPNLKVDRTDHQVIAMPPFSRVCNRVGIIFSGEEPMEMITEPMA